MENLISLGHHYEIITRNIEDNTVKKFLTMSITAALFGISSIAFAGNVEYTTNQDSVQPPVWEDYVPKKYQEPRSFPNKGKNIAEMSVGVVLTDLIITAPIGVPMICHSATKMKNQTWYKRKIKFEEGLKQAETIENPQEKQIYYNNLLKECKMIEQ